MRRKGQYFPPISSSIDPSVAEQLRQLWLRVNTLLERMGEGPSPSPSNRGIVPTAPSRSTVSIPAASDALLTEGTYASANNTQFSNTSVTVAGGGDGFTLSGPSSSLTFSVSNAATARTALGVTLPTGGAAHTITLLKLTGGGTDGSITWDANGWVTAYVDPT